MAEMGWGISVVSLSAPSTVSSHVSRRVDSCTVRMTVCGAIEFVVEVVPLSNPMGCGGIVRFCSLPRLPHPIEECVPK